MTQLRVREFQVRPHSGLQGARRAAGQRGRTAERLQARSAEPCEPANRRRAAG